MENETIIEQVENPADKYLDAIEEMKKNTVDKKQYNQLKEENKRLFDTLVSGGQIESPKEKVDVDKLRKELYSGEQTLSNLDYWTKTLQLREALIESANIDPFIPSGSKVAATEEDLAAAERVANGIQHCIDVAEGDNSIFTNELQRIMIDTMPVRRKK